MAEIQVIVSRSYVHEGRIGFWLWLGYLSGAKTPYGGRDWCGPACSGLCLDRRTRG